MQSTGATTTTHQRSQKKGFIATYLAGTWEGSILRIFAWDQGEASIFFFVVFLVSSSVHILVAFILQDRRQGTGSGVDLGAISIWGRSRDR